MLMEAFDAARSLPENQDPVKRFALSEAWHILGAAFVEDPINESQRSSILADEIKLHTYGEAVRHFIARIGVSQRELAEQIGVNTTHFNKTIRGRRNPPRSTVVLRLADK